MRVNGGRPVVLYLQSAVEEMAMPADLLRLALEHDRMFIYWGG